jgi:hypothetical protein
VLSRTDYSVEIFIVDGVDIFPHDNTAIFMLGFAEITIDDVREARTATGRQLIATITNRGLNEINFAEVGLLDENLEVFGSEEIKNLSAGASVEIIFDIDESYLCAMDSEQPRLFYLFAEYNGDYERSYCSRLIDVFPDYFVIVIADSGGTVSGEGKYARGENVTVSAIPAP